MRANTRLRTEFFTGNPPSTDAQRRCPYCVWRPQNLYPNLTPSTRGLVMACAGTNCVLEVNTLPLIPFPLLSSRSAESLVTIDSIDRAVFVHTEDSSPSARSPGTGKKTTDRKGAVPRKTRPPGTDPRWV